MTIVIDNSAVVAIGAGELDADALSDRRQRNPGRLCALSVWKTVGGTVRGSGVTIAEARGRVGLSPESGGLRFVAIRLGRVSVRL